MNLFNFCLVFQFFIQTSLGLEDEKKLQEHLISNYNRLVRPVEKNTDILDLKLGLKLIQILDIDEKNQILLTKVWVKHIWKDINLRWNPAEYANLTKVSIPSTSIWIPDIILFNSADGKYEISLMTRAKIDYEGNVVWEPPAIYKSHCTINVEFFPFDQQHCIMKFGSWTYDGLQVNLIHISQDTKVQNELNDEIPVGIDLTDFHQSHEWDVMSVPAKRSVVKQSGFNEFYPEITFNIYLSRKTLFYTCNLIIPCVSLTFLTVLTFYLPSESGEKISLCISILLSLTVFILLPNELIPPTSLVVPLIGKYLIFIIIIVTLSITCTIVVLNIHFRSPNTHEMPKWTRRLFLNVLPKLLMMKRPNMLTTVSASHLIKEYAESFIEKDHYDDYLQKIECEHLNLLDARYGYHNPKRTSHFMRSTRLFSKNKIKINNSQQLQHFLNKNEALDAVSNICDHFKKEERQKRIKQEWRYIALVIDRILLVTFSTACLAGTTAIILQAPSFYDTKTPIDQLMSKHFKRGLSV